MKVAGFFAGVGGIELGFKQAGYEIVYSNELDAKAAQTLQLNCTHKVLVDNIHNIESGSIPDVDVIVGGFPCQAFSIAGYKKGFEDEKGELFFQVARIIKDKRPRAILLENVKNLVNHDHGNTYKVIRETLESYGYKVTPLLLNATQYGNTPQNRERVYIVGFLNQMDYDNFKGIDPIPLTKGVGDIVDYNLKVDDKYYYAAEKNKFNDEPKANIVNPDTVYQWRRVATAIKLATECTDAAAGQRVTSHE